MAQLSPIIFVSAAEPSADLHGAALIRAIRSTCPSARLVGVAGPRMVEAGCQPIFDMTQHSAMLLGTLGALGSAIAMMRRCDHYLRGNHVNAAVVIDSPTLHLPLAGKAHALGIPVLYYIAPQMWAWGAYRIYKLRHRVSKVAAILPFEEAYFRDRGIDATFVGHPLVDSMSTAVGDPANVQRIRGNAVPLVGLLPGSRKHVVEEVFPGQLEVAQRIASHFPNVGFAVSVANASVRSTIERTISGIRVPIQLCQGNPDALIHAADLVLVASGTTTLQVALCGTPMIVMYNASRLFYHLIGRWFIQTPYLSLPNILAQREIVPEFMPYYNSTEPIAARAIQLLSSVDEREAMTQDLDEIVAPLRGGQASAHTAKMLMEMIADHG